MPYLAFGLAPRLAHAEPWTPFAPLPPPSSAVLEKRATLPYGTYMVKVAAPPEVMALRRLAKGRGVALATQLPEGGRARKALLGLEDIPHAQYAAGPRQFRADRPDLVVLHHNSGGGEVRGGVNINASSLVGAMDDKWSFAQIMEHGTGGGPGLKGAIPKTDLLENALQRHGGDMEKVKAEFGGNFVIKARSGARTKAEDLLTGNTHPRDPRLLRALNEPRSHIIQEKLDIKQEYRVHLLNNGAFTASYRYLPSRGLREHLGKSNDERVRAIVEGAWVPLVGPKRQALMGFAEKATAHIGRRPDGTSNFGTRDENFHHALDIAETHGGQFKVIESNPVPGTLMNPIVSRKLHAQITGHPDAGTTTGLAVAGVGAALGVHLLGRARSGSVAGKALSPASRLVESILGKTDNSRRALLIGGVGAAGLGVGVLGVAATHRDKAAAATPYESYVIKVAADRTIEMKHRPPRGRDPSGKGLQGPGTWTQEKPHERFSRKLRVGLHRAAFRAGQGSRWLAENPDVASQAGFGVLGMAIGGVRAARTYRSQVEAARRAARLRRAMLAGAGVAGLGAVALGVAANHEKKRTAAL